MRLVVIVSAFGFQVLIYSIYLVPLFLLTLCLCWRAPLRYLFILITFFSVVGGSARFHFHFAACEMRMPSHQLNENKLHTWIELMLVAAPPLLRHGAFSLRTDFSHFRNASWSALHLQPYSDRWLCVSGTKMTVEWMRNNIKNNVDNFCRFVFMCDSLFSLFFLLYFVAFSHHNLHISIQMLVGRRFFSPLASMWGVLNFSL